MAQIHGHRESTERQYGLQEWAHTLGWATDTIQVIDRDLGLFGAQASNRQGFQDLATQVSLGRVGAIFGLEISRLARSSADLQRLLQHCALLDTLVVDSDGVYDLREINDRLILGFKGTMSEAELSVLRGRLLEAKRHKAVHARWTPLYARRDPMDPVETSHSGLSLGPTSRCLPRSRRARNDFR